MDLNLPKSAHAAAQLFQTSSDDKDLDHRLGLYQVFVRLYDQHRGLLDEILALENLNPPGGDRLSPRYVLGMVDAQTPYLLTNLLGGRTCRLFQREQTWLIGRASEAALTLGDRRLSRHHATIRHTAAGFEIRDLGSTNGTFVNGEPVRHFRLLQEGDRVRVGGITFMFFEGQVRQVAPALPQSLQGGSDRSGSERSGVAKRLMEDTLTPWGAMEEQVSAGQQAMLLDRLHAH